MKRREFDLLINATTRKRRLRGQAQVPSFRVKTQLTKIPKVSNRWVQDGTILAMSFTQAYFLNSRSCLIRLGFGSLDMADLLSHFLRPLFTVSGEAHHAEWLQMRVQLFLFWSQMKRMYFYFRNEVFISAESR
jgi:hypothetical protein